MGQEKELKEGEAPAGAPNSGVQPYLRSPLLPCLRKTQTSGAQLVHTASLFTPPSGADSAIRSAICVYLVCIIMYGSESWHKQKEIGK